MDRHDWLRFWLHFPVGLAAYLLMMTAPVVGVTFAATFVAYEVLNDWRKIDESYKDVSGFAFGLGVPAILWMLVSQLV